MAPSASILCSVVAQLLLQACAASQHFIKRDLATDDVSAPGWTYRRTSTSGEQPYGPSDWHKGYVDCGGEFQSPINIAASTSRVVKAKYRELKFYPNECSSEDLSFLADGSVWKVSFDGCKEQPHLEFRGEAYNLAQIHIHSPSEHAIGGALHAAEIHWVHIKEGTDAELLVVGVLFDTSLYGENIELQNMWDSLQADHNIGEGGVTTRVYDLMPSSPAFSTYHGSLTTPPCTEGVEWIVMSEPVLMSERQLDLFRHSVANYDDSKVSEEGNTNRPYQPLGEREVLLVMPAQVKRMQ